ncbi:MAG TPA: NfeD family protein, partial [Calditrichia bacterium]|nr:NfeD family protein [Calditrichia bacterium]
PGFGFAGIVGVLCLALFFGAQYIINLASSFEIILFAIGVVLLFIELFVTPGFGVMGGLGILCMVSSIFMSLLPNMETVTFGNMTGVAGRLSLTFLLTFLVAVIAGRYLPKTEFWNRISLQEEQRREAGYVSSRNYETYLGKTGIAITPLRPAGTGEFAGERMDVVSEGGFVDAQTPIKIVKVDGYRLVVREEGRRV